MIVIPVVLLIVGLLLAVVAGVFGSFTNSPVLEYAAGIPRWATLWFLPLAFLLFVVSAIEWAVRKPAKTAALPWAIGLTAAWLGAWAGNGLTSTVQKKILG